MTNIEKFINNLPYHFYFLVVDEFLDIHLPNLTHFTSISPSTLGITLDQKNSGRLLSNPACIDYIKTNTKDGRIPAIIPFKPSAKIDLICKQNNWTNISNPSKTNRFFEDKIEFAKLLEKHSITQIPHIITTLSNESFEKAQVNFGKELVIQTHFGWAGNSSHLTHDFIDISTKVIPGTPVKIMPYLSGISYINNCVQSPQGLIQSPPGLQYTGLTKLSKNPLATTGRQWPSHSDNLINAQINKITNDFGAILREYKYLGFFGLDFFAYKDKVYLIECNPRLTASFAFYTAIEQKNNYEPLFYYHLLSFLPHQYPLDLTTQNYRFNDRTIVGSEITLKSEKGTTTKKYNDFIDFAPNGNPSEIDQTILSKVLYEVI